MKKIIFILALILIPIDIFAFEIKSKHAVLYNLNENNIIYSKDMNAKVPIASMTKIMTCIVAIESIDNLDKYVVMTDEMYYKLASENASVAGFKVGETVTYRDLLYGLMLPSGAEAAQGLAILTSGSIDNFVKKMNDKASSLKLTNTHFANPTGLDSSNNYSTVYDVAQLLMYALKNDTFKTIFEANSYTTSNQKHTFLSTRKKTSIDTSFIDGSKTGFTYDAGLCLASTAHYNNVYYLLVTANAPYNDKSNHVKDAKTIYNYYFDNYEEKVISKNGDKIADITLSNGEVITLTSSLDKKKYLEKTCELTKEYTGKTELTDDDKFNDVIGKYIIKCSGEVLYENDIVLNIDTSIKKDNSILISIIVILSGSIVLLTIIFIFILRRRKKLNT